MHRIDSSEARFKNNLTISINKTLRTNHKLEIRNMPLDRLNSTIEGQIWSIRLKLSCGNDILPLINQINFRHNLHNLNDPNPSPIEFSNNGDWFDIKLEVNRGQNHEVTTFWLLDNFIYSIVSSIDICSLIVGTLFDVPNKNLYPDTVRDHLNKKNQNKEISKLFRRYIPPLSNPNYLQTGRNIWNNAKHGGLHRILKVSHDLPNLKGTHWNAYIHPAPNSKLSPDEIEIGKFCGNLLEESIQFIDSVYKHLGNRLSREKLPLQI